MRSALLVVIFSSLCGAQTLSTGTLLRQGDDAEQRGDFASAVGDYQQALKLTPGLLAARINLANALMQLGRLDEARDNYRMALRQDPSDVRIVTLLANCLVVGGHDSDAIRLLAPVEESHPNDLDAVFLLGEALIHQGKLKDGLTRVLKVAEARRDANAWMLAGLTQLQLGDGAAALKSTDNGLRLDATTPGAYTLSGIAKSLVGDSSGAKAAFLEALQADPDDFEANVRLGTILREQGSLPEAEQRLNHALSLNRSSLAARYQFAELEVAEGRRESAAADLESIARTAPKILEVHEQLAALDFRLHRPEDGEREKQIVDHLLAAPQEQDHRLEGAVLISDPTKGSQPGKAIKSE
jgi:tetratricopeptide (TPR) repeat protein